MRAWTRKQWLVAVLAALAATAVMGLATAVIPNPVFVRMIPTPWWAYPVWIASAVLIGLIAGTYVAPFRQEETGGQRRRSIGGAVLAWFAVGCPTCNVLAVAALGTSGAVSWFQPLQPVLAVASLVLLGFALRSRLRNAAGCRYVPSEQSS